MGVYIEASGRLYGRGGGRCNRWTAAAAAAWWREGGVRGPTGASGTRGGTWRRSVQMIAEWRGLVVLVRGALDSTQPAGGADAGGSYGV